MMFCLWDGQTVCEVLKLYGGRTLRPRIQKIARWTRIGLEGDWYKTRKEWMWALEGRSLWYWGTRMPMTVDTDRDSVEGPEW